MSIERFKACLVAKGFHQRSRIDYQETFSHVIKPASVRLVLGHAAENDWPLRQLDINNVFLQGTLEEDVYMSQPSGFVDKNRPDYVCKLHKALYGLKEIPRAWYLELQIFLLQSVFKNSQVDASLFILTTPRLLIYLLVYVYDIIISGSENAMVERFIGLLGQQFSLEDLDHLSYFLGVKATRSSQGLLITQRKYINDLLAKINMSSANLVSTPMASNTAIHLHSGTAMDDGSAYRQLVGSLQYLQLTRPDVAFAVNRLSQFMHKPTDIYFQAAK